MERTTVPFASILIKASTHSGWDVYLAVNVEHTFILPENALEDEDHPTKWFSIPQILDDNIVPLLNSS